MRPTAIQPVGFVGLVIFTCFKLVIHARLKCGFHILNFALRDQPVLDQPFRIQRQRGFLTFDFIVHDRVGEHRLIAFVMSKPAVAEHVNDHIFLEFLPEFCSDFCRMHHRFWIIAVDVEYGRFDHQGNVCGIRRGPAEVRRGGKPDLIVDNHMHGAAGAVAKQTGQAEAFGHYALAGKGGIAMQQQWHHLGALLIAKLLLFGAYFAKHHGVYRF